jgi:hypothetical protein
LFPYAEISFIVGAQEYRCSVHGVKDILAPFGQITTLRKNSVRIIAAKPAAVIHLM